MLLLRPFILVHAGKCYLQTIIGTGEQRQSSTLLPLRARVTVPRQCRQLFPWRDTYHRELEGFCKDQLFCDLLEGAARAPMDAARGYEILRLRARSGESGPALTARTKLAFKKMLSHHFS